MTLTARLLPLPPRGRSRGPRPALTRRSGAALGAAGLTCTTGPTVTTDAPYRTTAEEISLHRTAGARGVEMEAAALFASARPAISRSPRPS